MEYVQYTHGEATVVRKLDINHQCIYSLIFMTALKEYTSSGNKAFYSHMRKRNLIKYVTNPPKWGEKI